MVTTEKLYYTDPYMKEFTAKVLSCEPDGKRFRAVFDRTAFYPEGGGQPADRGTAAGTEVLDVHEKDGIVYHSCSAYLEPGTEVSCAIDWDRRFDHMQQHSGEHIVSGMICSAFGCSNVGFHMGADSILIDYDAYITDGELQQIEDRANAYIWEDHPVCIQWPSAGELEKIDYRSKKALTGDVRIVSFPGADCCACCGTHVSSSGGVGLVKFISRQRFHDGVRLELLCGKRALAHLDRHRLQNLEISRELSAKWHSTAAAVEKLVSDAASARLRADTAEENYFRLAAASFEGRGDTVILFPSLTQDSTRKLCDAVRSVCGGSCAVFAGENGAYKYAVMTDDDAVLREMVKSINSALNGRGGGRGGLAMGSAACTGSDIRGMFPGVCVFT